MKRVVLIITLVFFSATVFAQEKLNNQSILKMISLGLSDDVIIEKIKSEPTLFDTSIQSLSELKEKGVSDQIILTILQKQKYQISDDFIYSVEYINDKILLNNHIEVKKGDKLKVYLPYNMMTDFSHIKKKSSGFLKKIGSVAKVVSTGALAVGLGSSNINTSLDALRFANKVHSIELGSEALKDLDKLSISKNAKKIVGKTFEVTDIIINEDGISVLEGIIDSKKYTAELPNVFILGELKIK